MLAGGHEQAAYRCIVDRMQITFDGTREVMLAISGPAGEYADSTSTPVVQAPPGAHTTVGIPVGGLTGSFEWDAAAFLVISALITIENNLELRNKELGTRFASGIGGRTNHRRVTASVTFYVEDTAMIQNAGDETEAVLKLFVGDTDGERLACLMPKVLFEIPDIGNEIGLKEVTIEGVGYATNGNDGVFLAEM